MTDSNCQPLVCKTSTLPIELIVHGTCNGIRTRMFFRDREVGQPLPYADRLHIFNENMLETLVRIPRLERGLLRLSVVRFNQLIYTRIWRRRRGSNSHILADNRCSRPDRYQFLVTSPFMVLPTRIELVFQL